MRVTSELYVAQLVRRVFADGGFAAMVRRGAEAAGAVFVVARDRGGAIRLFEPAVQSFADAEGERRFMESAVGDADALADRFASEARFDPDFWVVEIETDEPEAFVTRVAADPE